MRKRTLRSSLKLLGVLSIALFIAILLDAWLWESVAMWLLLGAQGLLLIFTTILVATRAAAPYERIDTVDEVPRVIIYPRQHG